MKNIQVGPSSLFQSVLHFFSSFPFLFHDLNENPICFHQISILYSSTSFFIKTTFNEQLLCVMDSAEFWGKR